MTTDQAASLTAFIAARYDEAEVAAKATAPSGQRLAWAASHEVNEEGTLVHWVISDPNPAGVAYALGLERGTGHAVAEHIACYDPAHRLADIKLKRAILAGYTAFIGRERGWDGDESDPAVLDALEQVVRQLGTEFIDHPDYRQEEWKP